MREPSHRLTQHKRRGGRSLLVLRDPEEAPTLFFKGSKPGAATAGWSLFSWERFDIQRATRASSSATLRSGWQPTRRGRTQSMLSPHRGPNIDFVGAIAAITPIGCLPSWQMRSMGWLLDTSYSPPASGGERSGVGLTGGHFIRSIAGSTRLVTRRFPHSGDGWPRLSLWDQMHF